MMCTDSDLDNIKPFHPLPFRKGNTVLSQWDEPFMCNAGNKGVATYVKYTNSKGKVIDKHFLRVKWDD